MNKNRYIILYLFVILISFLTACERSASTTSIVTPTFDGGMPFPAVTQSPVLPEIISGTQTSIAKSPTVPTKAVITQEPEVFATTTATTVLSPTTSPEPTTSVPSHNVFSGESGIPTIGIYSVAYNESVTIQANDFPQNMEFTVLMGVAGSHGVDGIEVGSFDTGSGGTYLATYDIPDSLIGISRIDIRIEFIDTQYAFNWFYNSTTN